jgi:hypothetical protein
MLNARQIAKTPIGAAIIAVAAMFLFGSLLSGCASTGGHAPTLAEVRDNACPVILGTVAGLQVTPEVTPEIKAQLKEIEPIVVTACAVSSTPADLTAMANAVFPVILQITAASELAPEQKQTVIIAITTARLMIANLPHHPAAGDLPAGEAAP